MFDTPAGSLFLDIPDSGQGRPWEDSNTACKSDASLWTQRNLFEDGDRGMHADTEAKQLRTETEKVSLLLPCSQDQSS